MKKLAVTLTTILLLSVTGFSYSQTLSYNYLIESGKISFQQGRLPDAFHYFTLAHTVSPYAPEAQEYLDLITVTASTRTTSLPQGQFHQVSKLPPEIAVGKEWQLQRRTQISRSLDQLSAPETISPAFIDSNAIHEKLPNPAMTLVSQAHSQTLHTKPKNVVTLSEENKNKFPLTVELSIEDYFFIKGNNVNRVLVLDPEIALVEKKDNSTIVVTAQKYGSTFLHVWDSQGRWTLDVRVLPGVAESQAQSQWQEAQAFIFWYNNDWRNYYRGNRFSLMTRQTLQYEQEAGMRGPTPYGDFDASLDWSKTNKIEELTQYTIGLQHGNVAGFKDFTTRAFDFTTPFSDFTFPGNTLRGFMFASPAFNDTIEYAVIHGQLKSYFFSAAFPQIAHAKEDSYIEGLRVGLFPRARNSVYINYARGYGKDRDPILKEKVFSLQTEHRYDPFFVNSEFAYDESSAAGKLVSQLKLPHVNLRMSLRDIEPNFVNITSRPPNMGELGSLYEADWAMLKNVTLRSSLDIYRNRVLFNESNANALNHDITEFLDINLPYRSSINSSLYYNNDPQLSSPARNLSGQSIYNKLLDLDVLGHHRLSTHAGYSFQQSINPLSPSSDYQRQGVLSGFSFSLINDISWYYDYNYSWLKELSTDERFTPRVIETGLDISHAFNPQVQSNARFGYRKEQNATAVHSFLAGENSFEGSLYLTYMPQPGVELFCDGRVREVWPVIPEAQKFTEADFRTGARLTWESFLRWAPSTKIEGIVYKDANGNGKYDRGEAGVAGVKIAIGPKEVVTNAQGKFSTIVRAKEVTASVLASTIPTGFVSTTPNVITLATSHGGRQTLSYGLTTQAGVYGIVFYDANGNKTFDSGDIPVEFAVVSCDNSRLTKTSANGVYSFNGLTSGQHAIALDVNSLPMEYFPVGSVKTQIKIEESGTANLNFPLQKK